MTEKTIRRVGYVGLGIMGAPMARNLIDAGYELTVYNRTASKAEPFAQLGAQVVGSLAELAQAGLDVICINVTDTPDVEAVLFAEGGLAEHAPEGLTVIDHSTISPMATRSFADRLEKQGVTLLDAPVSGGDVGAKNATLSIMVGGEAQAFARCRALFEVVGKNITHLGPAGSGQACKACNQVAVSCTLVGVCEAIALAKKTGLDLEKMLEVVGGGAAGSWQLTNLGPKIAAGDDAPGFMIDLLLKDLNIVADTARTEQLPMPATALAEQLFRRAQAMGLGQRGTQAVAKAVE